MLGAFIGDIVGSVYEFKNTRDYDFTFISKSSNITDDSIMTAAIAEWVMSDSELSHEELEKKLVSYAMEFPHPCGGYGANFKRWLFNPTSLYSPGYGMSKGKRMPYNSWGNGSAMRVSSIGWMSESLEITEHVAEISATITHNHIEGIKGAKATAAAIYLARTGRSKDEIKEYIKMRYNYNLDRTWRSLHKNYSWDSSCQGTVPEAIICFLDSHDFESAVRNAVSIGGDSDTLACITGGIAEAFYGYIPKWMVDKALDLLPFRIMGVMRIFVQRTVYSTFFYRYGKNIYDLVKYTPQYITELKNNEIFVFGSNIEGKHFGGAARLAYDKFDAEWGVGVGRTGQCYAIPTMHGGIDKIKPYVDHFIEYACLHPEYIFYVTKIGCGIAGFRTEEIAPLFIKAFNIRNIILPKDFHSIILNLLLNK